MANRTLDIARRYHEATKHSPRSVQIDRHFLDWNNQPLQFKIYPDLDPIHLPVDLPESGESALAAISGTVDSEEGSYLPSLTELAYLLYCTGGITKKLVHAGGETYFRAAANAGALYPIEIYLVCRSVEGLPAGVYHFSPADFAMRRIREGDYLGHLVQACGAEKSVLHAPAVFVFTAITWRSSWKYQARSYRYHFWDCGTMLANAMAGCTGLKLPAKIVMGFVDHFVSRLIAINGIDEKPVSLLSVGKQTEENQPRQGDVQELRIQTLPLSNDQVDYRIIEDIHLASTLQTAEEAEAWRGETIEWDSASPAGLLYKLKTKRGFIPQAKSLEEVIVKRGSTRRFIHEPISFYILSTLLEAATSDLRADWYEPDAKLLNDIYLCVHAVDGIPPGTYVFHKDLSALEQLKQGDFRSLAAHASLGQELGGDASVTIFFLADLQALLERFGNRGYRIVQVEAGLIGGRLYLGAYALGLGATGLTFFDDEAVRLFSPHSDGLEAIFEVALGVPSKAKLGRGKFQRVKPGDPVNVG